ncbi:MAG: long-chain fatty acid--CoA ligase [Bacteroidetes bacterium]|nr:long-chain fatty acid--CoA ligase [Bacteroidota bacterium]
MTNKTLQDIFRERSDDRFASCPYILYKVVRDEPYRMLTYGEFTRRSIAFAAALHALGIQRGDRILIASESRPEWMITDFASIILGAISVPVFPTLTSHQTQYIVEHSQAKLAVVSSEYQLRKILAVIDQLPLLESVIVMDDTVQLPTHERVRFEHFSKLETEFAGTTASYADVTPDDVVTIIYTSGTTGVPKGVMLTHRNLVSNVAASRAAIPAVDKDDIFLSFLPLSHGFERVASYLKFSVGLQVAYAESIDSVARNLVEIKPTVMTAVPRFFERVYSRIDATRASLTPTRRYIFDWGMRVGAKYAKPLEGERVGILTRALYPIADTLVLKKVRERTGGKIRFIFSGGAALKPELGRAFAALGITILEGYGLTETSPVVAVNREGSVRWGTVGHPIDGVEVRIADDGEILVRGENVMKGYYRDEHATRQMIDADGWLHTGDIGVCDEQGRIRITDRKKHLIILANGKNIAPAPIESMIESSPLIDQVVVLGELRDFCSALIVPNHEAIADPATARHQIEQELARINRELAGYEKIRRFELLAEPFTLENGMLTPTLKVRRKEVERRYADLIEGMYADRRSHAE